MHGLKVQKSLISNFGGYRYLILFRESTKVEFTRLISHVAISITLPAELFTISIQQRNLQQNILSLTDLTGTRSTDPKYLPYRHSHKPLYPDTQLFVKGSIRPPVISRSLQVSSKLLKKVRLYSYQHKQIRLSNFSKVAKSVCNRFLSVGILEQSGRGFPIHVCTVGTYHYCQHTAMGEKITTQSFPSGGAVGSGLELSLGDRKLFAKIVMV